MLLGLYICQCNGQVSKTIDTAALTGAFAKAKGMAVCAEHSAWCSAEGIARIRQNIQDGVIDRVVIAGCSPRAHGETMARALEEAGLNRYLVEFCNLREQCAWVHADDAARATQKAKTLIGMSLARTRGLEPLAPIKYPAVNRVLVIGGGIAGLSAAQDLAAAGVEVVIAEKQAYLGGKVIGFHKYFPRLCPPQCGVDFMTTRLQNSRVDIHTETEVESIAGSPGNFKVNLVKRPRYVDLERCTACGECAAVCPVERENTFDLGLSKSATQSVIARSGRVSDRRRCDEAMTKAIYLPFDLAYPRAYVVDRARCPADCELCAKHCPIGAVRLDQKEERFSVHVGSIIAATGAEQYDASRIERYGYGRHANVVTNLEFERLASRNGPTGGQLVRLSDGKPIKRIAFIQCVGSRDIEHLPHCSQICCTVTLKQIGYVREADADAQVWVFYMDMRAIGEYELMYKEAQEKHGAIFVRGNPFEVVEKPLSKELVVRAEDTLSARPVEVNVDLVVLATGLKPNASLEALVSGLEGTAGHAQCSPYELRRTGIYAAGSCQGPTDVQTAVKSAGGAAMKAMAVLRQEIEISPTIPVVDKNKCDKCKRCMEECPFDAWYWDDTGYPAPDLLKCRQCGTCQGGCPMRVISLKNFTIKQGAAMIQAINSSFAGKGQPTILAFLCANDAYPAADLAGQKRYTYPANVVNIAAPCAGSINVAWVTDALSNGIDGVMIAGCKSDQCHYARGSDLAQTRLSNMQETLKRMMVEPERVKIVNLGITDAQPYAQCIQEFVADLQRLGPSPFK
ncbi:MAG: hydrogenase iron-sulfur subunit [Chloroflexi bacterium]|nr:hydrogenase iron-sulfur subunit [Chloroflexota bacterium]